MMLCLLTLVLGNLSVFSIRETAGAYWSRLQHENFLLEVLSEQWASLSSFSIWLSFDTQSVLWFAVVIHRPTRSPSAGCHSLCSYLRSCISGLFPLCPECDNAIYHLIVHYKQQWP